MGATGGLGSIGFTEGVSGMFDAAGAGVDGITGDSATTSDVASYTTVLAASVLTLDVASSRLGFGICNAIAT